MSAVRLPEMPPIASELTEGRAVLFDGRAWIVDSYPYPHGLGWVVRISRRDVRAAVVRTVDVEKVSLP